MQFFKVSTILLVILLGISIQVNGGVLGGGLKALKKLKDGLPLLGGAGLLGAMKLALLSKAGLALGTIGTALGAAALAKQKKEDSPQVIYYGHDSYGQNSYGGGGGYGGGYGWRRRRDTGEVESDIDTEEAFEFVKESDPSRCTERLVCEIASKATKYPNKLEEDEAGIITFVSGKPSKSGYRSFAHKQLQSALRKGYNNVDCQAVYATCTFKAEQMMSVVRMATRSFFQSPPMSLKQFIEKK